MIVIIVCPEKDQTIPLYVQDDLTLENFRALCSVELDIPSERLLLNHHGTPLKDDTKTLGSYCVQDNDMILVQNIPNPVHSEQQQQGKPTGMPKIDFSTIRIPGQPTTSRQPASRQDYFDMHDPETLRQKFLNSPHDLAILKERNPAFAAAIVKGGEAFIKELERMREAQAQIQREKIRMLNADPLDPEVQNKIAEEIRQQNIQENMNMAIEEAPESFGQVVMLWINVKVNGHSVKAFVDSGAQMTIMSAECAENCNIMRLVDRRWEGIAKGVGTQKIIGRIHLAQMQIENDFLQCSFSVLEDQPMHVLLGLDMLRRHQCCIDLKENMLRIGTTGTKTQFLPESELPLHNRLHDPNDNRRLEVVSQGDEDQLMQASSKNALQQNGNNSNDVNEPASCEDPFPDVGRTLGSPGSSQRDSSCVVKEHDIKALTGMGFNRAVAEQELKACDGDLQRAIVNLLARSLRSP